MVDEYQYDSSIELCTTERQPQCYCRRRRPRQDLLSAEYSGTHPRSRNRLPLLIVLIFICSALLRKQVAVVDASSSRSLGIPLRIPAIFSHNKIRGGGSDAAGSEEVKEQDEEEGQEKQPGKTRKLWPVDNLFRLNDDVKSEAASVMNKVVPLEDEKLHVPLVEQPLSKTSKKEGPRNNSRGGALTMVKAPKAKTRRFAWLAPLDTSKVAPSSSRLLPDEKDQVEQGPDVAAATDPVAVAASATPSENATVADTKTASSAEMTSFNQIWWGNVWDQQLPDDDEQVEMQVEMESANDLISDEVPESPVQKPERKQPSGRKAKRKASREASVADTKSKQNTEVSRGTSATDAKSKQDAEALPAVEKDMIQSYNDDGCIAGNITRMEQEIQEETQLRPALTLTAQPIHTANTTRSQAGDASPSPFVSSGYVSYKQCDLLALSLFTVVVACIHAHCSCIHLSNPPFLLYSRV